LRKRIGRFVKIIESTYRMVFPRTEGDGLELLWRIEDMARISHRSEELKRPDTYKRFITSVVLEHGDWSVVEHASATVIFRVPRGVTHELVRHRLFSYTQESTRFVNGRKSYPNGLEFIKPVAMDATCVDDAHEAFARSCAVAEEEYLTMLDKSIRPQEARAVLPNALAATIAVTGNLRSWRHLFIMRTTKETHPDFRAVTIPVLAVFQKLIPMLYDDIQPMAKQSDNLRLPR
jgi:thymidylate synthase (FAD)